MSDIVDLTRYRSGLEGSVIVDMNNWRPRLGRKRIPDAKWLKLREHNRVQIEKANQISEAKEHEDHLDFEALNWIENMREIAHTLGFVGQGSPADDAQFGYMMIAHVQHLTLV